MLIVINEEPIAQGRPRLSNVKGRVLVYDPNAGEKASIKNLIQSTVINGLHSPKISTREELHKLHEAKSFKVEMQFHCSFPSSKSMRFNNLVSWGYCPRNSKPDLDNYVKFYLDCLNGSIFPDDSKVTTIIAKKIYSHNPKVVIRVSKEDDLLEDAKGVLSLVDMEEFCEFAKSIAIVGKAIEEAREDYREVSEANRLAAAGVLSEFSEVYAKLLVTVQKKYPGLYEKIYSLHDR